MTSTAALKSASFALKAFLEGKPTGYSFTVDSLREDYMTYPATIMTLSRGAVSGFVSKAYERGAFDRQREAGHVRRYTLKDAALIHAKNRRSIGTAKGTLKRPYHARPDSLPPAIPSPLPGLGAPAKPAPEALAIRVGPGIQVPKDIAERMTRDTMLGAIREIVDAHLEAFEAKRPAPEFPDAIACAARHGADLLQHISTDAILAEIKRRADHG